MRQAPSALRRAFGGRGALAPALLSLALALALAFALAGSAAEAQEGGAGSPAKHWVAGAYSFSDEHGGFRITAASGLGTRDDPIVLTQEFSSASPVTLVIRAVGPVRPFGRPGATPNGFLNLRLQTLNGSGVPWIEFEFELQEIPGVPSGFGDGLSFDQRDTTNDSVWSDSFRRFGRDFEPADRLLFREGKVDPGEVSAFGFLVTDFTPRPTFYLVEDPRIPFS